MIREYSPQEIKKYANTLVDIKMEVDTFRPHAPSSMTIERIVNGGLYLECECYEAIKAYGDCKEVVKMYNSMLNDALTLTK